MTSTGSITLPRDLLTLRPWASRTILCNRTCEETLRTSHCVLAVQHAQGGPSSCLCVCKGAMFCSAHQHVQAVWLRCLPCQLFEGWCACAGYNAILLCRLVLTSKQASVTLQMKPHIITHSLSHTDTHLIKRQSIGQLQTQHDHAGDPEEEDVMACLHQRQWVALALHKIQCFMSSNTQYWPNSPPCIKFNALRRQMLRTGSTPRPA